MSHTPGPWTVERDGPGMFQIVGPTLRDGLSCNGQWFDEDDARLIAAAPDLLEVAKATLEYWEETGFAKCDKGCDCIVEGMRAAIAQAEGR